MKKIYRVTYRHDKETNDCRESICKEISDKVGWKITDSEVNRSLFKVLLKDKRLRSAVVLAISKILENAS